MANTLITPSIIAKVGLANLENNLVMGRKVYRDYTREFVKVGNTISVRRPVQFQAINGATAVNQDVTEGKFSLVMGSRKHVSRSFNTDATSGTKYLSSFLTVAPGRTHSSRRQRHARN